MLQNIINRFQKNPGAHSQIINHSETPYIRIDFDSMDSLITEYSRGYDLFDPLLEKISTGEITIPIKEKVQENKSKTELYLILKYSTNYKQPLRKYYEFGSKVSNLFGVKMMVEEVSDGFLWFYDTLEDFMAGQVEFRSLTELKSLLIARNQWIDEFETIILAYLNSKQKINE